MPHAFNLWLRRRAAESEEAKPKAGLTAVEIAGTVVAAVIFLGVAIWLAIRWNRRRNVQKRQAYMGTAFLSVRGLVREAPGQQLARAQLASPAPFVDICQMEERPLVGGITFPQRVVTPRVGAGSRGEMLRFNRHSSGETPKPFSQGTSPSEPLLTSPPQDTCPTSTWARRSLLTPSSAAKQRFSVISSTSPIPESTTGSSRKVRQLFTPLLPDELLLVKLDEPLVLLQSFDDGWCLVGRENPSLVQQKTTLFQHIGPPNPDSENSVELGVVPAWCFLKPLTGLRVERPNRTSSLGITVKIESHGASSRSDVVSWSNF